MYKHQEIKLGNVKEVSKEFNNLSKAKYANYPIH